MDTGFDINYFIMDNKMTLLMTACSISQDQQLFELIFNYGPDYNFRGAANKTALHFAAAAGNVNALELLVAKEEVDKNAQTFGLETPLMESIRSNNA